jgi:hypothetical protein
VVDKGRQYRSPLASTARTPKGAAAMSIERSIKGADAVPVTVGPTGGFSMPTSEPLLTVTL